MRRLIQLTFTILIVSFLSCKNEESYSYAIKDFRQPLQEHLLKIVSKGIIMNYDSSLNNMATDNELISLSQSEHPVLRASAFREILYRKSFNQFDILMNHLDDTATVLADDGEFGIWDGTVSDYILKEASWKTQAEKDKTVEQVIEKHNYLRSAYHILLQIEPQEKYYRFIKDMSTRSRRLSYDGYELNFDDIEYALYGLAKFKKPDDIKIIENQMMQNTRKLSYVSFRLMKEFPDTMYYNVLQSYHRRQFYRFSGNRRDGFTGYIADKADPEDFIQALVMQQNQKSAKLLDTMLNRLPLQTCMPDRGNIIDGVIMEIWQHPCPAYKNLRKKIKSKAQEILKRQLTFTVDRPVDTTKKVIRWYR
jgi:hypothetical protein